MDATRSQARRRSRCPQDSASTSSIASSVAVVAAMMATALVSLGGCTSLMQPSALSAPRYSDEPPIFLDGAPRLVDPAKVDRYVCRNGQALDCRCFGRLAASCECSCPLLGP